jgi:hypothetical protein
VKQPRKQRVFQGTSGTAEMELREHRDAHHIAYVSMRARGKASS